VDKASKNIAVICKQYYLSKLLSECTLNCTGYVKIGLDSLDIVNSQIKFMKDMGITSDDCNNLPHIMLFPKFHKPILSQRYVISYSSCSIKPLAKKVALGLKGVFKQICNYANMMRKVTGINRNWIILNNEPILECLNNINENGKARNIQTYDFSTLYTNLDLDDIKMALNHTIKLAFRHSKKAYISIYSESFNWVDKPRQGTFTFDIDKLIMCTNYLIDNSYFSLGKLIFRQRVGVPIGVDPGPLIANLTLWYFENRFIDQLYRKDYGSALKLNNTFRLIDDITSVNSDLVFQEQCKLIYPANLILNKENVKDDKADVLDLSISIESNKFCVSVYDKRDNFPFEIVQFVPCTSNTPLNCSYGIFYSQVIRYNKICNVKVPFEVRVNTLFEIFVKQGYRPEKLIALLNKLHKRRGIPRCVIACTATPNLDYNAQRRAK